MKNLLERKYYMPFNLQLFAEGSEDASKDESNGNVVTSISDGMSTILSRLFSLAKVFQLLELLETKKLSKYGKMV